MATKSASLLDSSIFASELSVALYIVPIFFGGIGVNVVSHVLIRHLDDAERRFTAKRRLPVNAQVQ